MFARDRPSSVFQEPAVARGFHIEEGASRRLPSFEGPRSPPSQQHTPTSSDSGFVHLGKLEKVRFLGLRRINKSACAYVGQLWKQSLKQGFPCKWGGGPRMGIYPPTPNSQCWWMFLRTPTTYTPGLSQERVLWREKDLRIGMSVVNTRGPRKPRVCGWDTMALPQPPPTRWKVTRFLEQAGSLSLHPWDPFKSHLQS